MRTIEQIFQELITAKEAETELASLTSTSQTAVWRLLLYVAAVGAWTVENLLAQHKTEVNLAINNSRPGTALWYVEQAKKFQTGYVLGREQVSYSTLDEAAQIVTQASATSNPDELVLKVAKGTSPSFSPLSPAEITEFESYLDRIQFAGTKIRVESRAADLLRLNAEIFYDGQISASDIQTDVEAAVAGWLASIPFNSVLLETDLILAIRDVAGVFDVQVNAWQFQPAGGSLISGGRTYNSLAGYVNTDSATFSNTTYTAQ